MMTKLDPLILVIFFAAGVVASSIFWAAVLRWWVPKKLQDAKVQWLTDAEMRARDNEANPPLYGPSLMDVSMGLGVAVGEENVEMACIGTSGREAGSRQTRRRSRRDRRR